MLKSMTGFGKGQAADAGLSLSVEIKSVNQRFCDISVKAPRVLAPFEAQLKKRVGDRVKRGKVDLYINIDAGESCALEASVNRPLAKAYVAALQELMRDYPVSQQIPLELLAAQKDLLLIREAELDQQRLQECLFSALELALDGLEKMRGVEGEATEADLKSRCGQLASLSQQIEAFAPEVVVEWRQKLAQRLEKLTQELGVDPQRIAQEVAVFADRCDISEELIRFRSHLDQFEQLFEADEPVGRKMDFLVQELNRETNTMGSKSNHAELTRLVVELKAELEKIREQVQNVE